MIKELRLYSFINMYLSPLQHGLQTAHVVGELFVKYTKLWGFFEKGEYKLLREWADLNKTIIILNGGNSSNLLSIYNELIEINAQLKLPYTKFHEDEESLNRALTCVGVVVPMEYLRDDGYYHENTVQYRLRKLTSNYKLA